MDENDRRHPRYLLDGGHRTSFVVFGMVLVGLGPAEQYYNLASSMFD